MTKRKRKKKIQRKEQDKSKIMRKDKRTRRERTWERKNKELMKS